jgi:hypothetical protein
MPENSHRARASAKTSRFVEMLADMRLLLTGKGLIATVSSAA